MIHLAEARASDLLADEDGNELLGAPTANDRGVGQAVAQALCEGAGQRFAHLFTELDFRAAQPPGADQQQAVLARRRRADLFRQFLTGGEARDLIDGGGGFQGIDPLMEHADFHQELGGGELVLLAHLLQAVFDGISRGGDHHAQCRMARGGGDLAQFGKRGADIVFVIAVSLTQGIQDLFQGARRYRPVRRAGWRQTDLPYPGNRAAARAGWRGCPTEPPKCR